MYKSSKCIENITKQHLFENMCVCMYVYMELGILAKNGTHCYSDYSFFYNNFWFELFSSLL